MQNYNPFSLRGKTILVTGASSGIGKATAVECARMGANLIVTARNEERLNATLAALDVESGQKHKAVIADLLVAEQMEKLIVESGKIDGLVLCSGKGLTLPFQFSSRDKFDDIFETNFYAPVELMRVLYKKKQINKEGSVVILASLGGTEVFSGGNCIYGASKAALNSVMKFCAKEFAPRKVRVNGICPGMVDTPLIHRGTVSEEQLQEDMKRYPLKRYGRPEDIAYNAVYLLSDASAWMTGHAMVLDGGMSI
ncbi:SDR family NAD(P)-dependent oxidoreductase [Bacteroides fluxus]|uniref:SDR family NAD(P)-dependent oxidoreductase n=1 Tax=Bacteroides fluxus TaxID=626930 RepID=UPI0023526C65|nr:SDR family oxidoreductase [Bacteroides fluxus]